MALTVIGAVVELFSGPIDDNLTVPVLTAGLLTALGLASCASQLTPPAQPSPASIVSTQTALAAITGDPVSAWEAGDYMVRAACHAYLNEMAAREANMSLAGGALGKSAGPKSGAK